MLIVTAQKQHFHATHSCIVADSDTDCAILVTNLLMVESRRYVRFLPGPDSLLSQIHLSSVTFMRPTHGVETFGNISSSFRTLATLWPPCKILRRSSHQGTSPSGAFNLATCVMFGYLISWWVSRIVLCCKCWNLQCFQCLYDPRKSCNVLSSYLLLHRPESNSTQSHNFAYYGFVKSFEELDNVCRCADVDEQ